jgi:AcrR family transcriptional regulator
MTDRPLLNRARVARGALEFIDEHGLVALSMRKLGGVLGVEAMSLYNHVAGKDDLLDAVGDVLYREVLDDFALAPDGSWQEDARAMVVAVRSVALRHPEALDVLIGRALPSSIRYEFLEACYRIFTKAGLGAKDAALAFDAASSWIMGALTQELRLMASLELAGAGDATESGPPQDVVADFAAACMAWSPDQRFAFGLDTLISGLERQLGPS